MYMGNAEGWEAIYEDTEQAKEQVLWASWYWDSTMELVRPSAHASMTESQRYPYTAMGVMEEFYLFALDLPVVNPDNYGDPADLMADLRVEPGCDECTCCATDGSAIKSMPHSAM
mgnify:CR=1 FL=1